MRSHVTALFAAAIRDWRSAYLDRAGRAFVDADLAPEAVARAYRLAQLRWVDEHPTLAARIEGEA